MRLQHLVQMVLAKKQLAPVYYALLRLSLAGLGFMNPNSKLNGEHRFLEGYLSGIHKQSRNPIVFDVGANEGAFTGSVYKICDAAIVHCFEANPITAWRLKETFAGRDNCAINAVGVSEESGEMTLFDYKDCEGSSHASFLSETFDKIYRSESQQQKVPVVTLASYIAKQDIHVIDLLKVDVEGFEKQVLNGLGAYLKPDFVRAVQFEFNAHNLLSKTSLMDLISILEGYELYRIVSNGLVKITGRNVPYNSINEIYKYSNYVALPEQSS